MANRFKKFSGCYTCHACNKQTRETGDGESSVDLCALCFAKASNGNQLSDSGYQGTPDAWAVFDACQTVDECNRLLEVKLQELQS